MEQSYDRRTTTKPMGEKDDDDAAAAAVKILVEAATTKDMSHFAAATAAHAALGARYVYTAVDGGRAGAWLDRTTDAIVPTETVVDAILGAVGVAIGRAALLVQSRAAAAVAADDAAQDEATVQTLLTFAQRLRQRAFVRGVEIEARPLFAAAA